VRSSLTIRKRHQNYPKNKAGTGTNPGQSIYILGSHKNEKYTIFVFKMKIYYLVAHYNISGYGSLILHQKNP